MFRNIILVSLLPITLTITGCAKKEVQQNLEQGAEQSKAVINNVADAGQNVADTTQDVVKDVATTTASVAEKTVDTTKNAVTQAKETATKEVVELADNIAGGAETVVAGGDKVVDVNEPAEAVKIDASQQY